MTYKNLIKNQILLSLISPALAIYTVFNCKDERFIVFSGTLFFGFLGSVFIYAPGTDGYSHLQSVKLHYLDMSLDDFFVKTYEILTFQSTEVSTDMYKHVLAFLAGSVFGIPELLHVFSGLILGYFFTKSVLLVIENKSRSKEGALLLGFIALFLIVRSISALNSVRMWTGMWVFFYGSYGYIVTKNKRFLLIVFLSTVIHFSYFLYIIPVVFAYFLRSRKILISFIYILSFSANISFMSVSGLIPDLELLNNKQKYTNIDPDNIEESEDDLTTSKGNFYKKYGPAIYNNYSMVLLSFLLIIFLNNKNSDDNLIFLISAGLLLLALSNYIGFNPAASGRGKTIGATFLVAGALNVLINYQDYNLVGFQNRMVKLALWIFLISAIPYFLFNIAYAFGTISFNIFGAPFVSWMAGEDDLSIRDFLMLIF
ncbi:hypothetical protein [Rhodonellum sp.]|uniref:hypothetical protein n=1 Tax=Rhodonellum sp. TaxID=2231180 RepID=UPI002717C18B|nr:hypothetical protein [Rhodonellum sp.]MDO9551548.1 hypothetical protein [Rhodonellum sp.]